VSFYELSSHETKNIPAPPSREGDADSMTYWLSAVCIAVKHGDTSLERLAGMREASPSAMWALVIPQRIQAWNEQARTFERFVQSTGRMPQRTAFMNTEPSAAEVRLQNWVRNNRRTVDRLNAFKIDRLNHVPGFSWAPLEDRWETNYERYRDFVEVHGREPHLSRVKGTESDEHSLAIWANNQRRALTRRTLPANRVFTLVSLPGWVDFR